MASAEKPDRGKMRVDVEECKGCGLCVDACPPRAIMLNEKLNRYGYRTAMYTGVSCTACGICFMVCPEPGAITVLRIVQRASDEPRGIEASTPGASECASN
jgi:Pyruvate/2-oxoacid:ferredoxin oxidoreductase delta subunit